MGSASARVSGFGTTVFSEFSALAQRCGAVNLGQGFPDFDGPEEIREAAVRAIRDGVNQYATSFGAQVLRDAIAEHAHRFYAMKVDPDHEVTVTSGATEALFDAAMALVNPADEVVLFEPFYDAYPANVAMAQGVARYVRLRPPDVRHAVWWFEREELEEAFGQRTRLVVVNSPHNPTGKVFTRTELGWIAELCQRHDVYALCDEVYEHLLFPPATHCRLACLPGMADRTVTVSSGGKSFSLTGWKVGWAIACPELTRALRAAHQFVTFATSAPFQVAMAAALRLPDAYFTGVVEDYRAKRQLLSAALETAGLKPFPTEGSYFLVSPLGSAGGVDDFQFCRALTTGSRVAAIPVSAFQTEEGRRASEPMARFAFCKTEPALREAAARLATRPR